MHLLFFICLSKGKKLGLHYCKKFILLLKKDRKTKKQNFSLHSQTFVQLEMRKRNEKTHKKGKEQNKGLKCKKTRKVKEMKNARS